MSLSTKLLVGLLLLMGSFGAGWYYRGAPQQSESVAQTTETDRIITRTTEPQTGTVTETVREKITEKSKNNTRTASRPATPNNTRPNWAVSVLGQYDPREGDWALRHVVGGYRVVSGIWLNVGVDTKDRAALVGITVEFK